MKEERKMYNTIRDLNDPSNDVTSLSKEELEEDYALVENGCESNGWKPFYLKLNPEQKKLVKKLKQREKENYRLRTIFNAITTGIFAVILGSCSTNYGKHLRDIESISMTNSNSVQVVYQEGFTNTFYRYDGKYLPKKKIEEQVRKSAKSRLESSVKEEINQIIH